MGGCLKGQSTACDQQHSLSRVKLGMMRMTPGQSREVFPDACCIKQLVEESLSNDCLLQQLDLEELRYPRYIYAIRFLLEQLCKRRHILECFKNVPELP